MSLLEPNRGRLHHHRLDHDLFDAFCHSDIICSSCSLGAVDLKSRRYRKTELIVGQDHTKSWGVFSRLKIIYNSDR